MTENHITLGELKTDVRWLTGRADRAEPNAIGAVRSKVEENGEIRCETRYFITSLLDISTFSKAVRRHWGIENNLHLIISQRAAVPLLQRAPLLFLPPGVTQSLPL